VSTSTPRTRYRENIRAEIKELALTQITESGAAGISLNGIAKRMGMTGPGLYRYYSCRDELITELILDAYRELAEAVRACETIADPRQRLRSAALAIRDWALAHPQRYLLIFGTPVPGYRAPADTTAITRAIMAVLLDGFAQLHPVDPDATDLIDHLTHHHWAGDHAASPAALRRALAFWTRAHGVLSLELAGHFTGMGFDPALLYAADIDALLR
jgi:AcrR family transcriptional regulator